MESSSWKSYTKPRSHSQLQTPHCHTPDLDSSATRRTEPREKGSQVSLKVRAPLSDPQGDKGVASNCLLTMNDQGNFAGLALGPPPNAIVERAFSQANFGAHHHGHARVTEMRHTQAARILVLLMAPHIAIACGETPFVAPTRPPPSAALALSTMTSCGASFRMVATDGSVRERRGYPHRGDPLDLAAWTNGKRHR